MLSLLGAITEAVIRALETAGLPGLFALMAVESFGLPPLPSEVILPLAGFMVADGLFPLPVAVGIALAGGLTGALGAYAVGRRYGDRLVGVGVGRWRLERRHLNTSARWFARHGEAAVAFCRMVPGIRGYVSYPAGAARMPVGRFSLYTTLGSAPFVVALVYAGFLLRSDWRVVSANWGVVEAGALAVVGTGLLVWAVTRRRGMSARTPAR